MSSLLQIRGLTGASDRYTLATTLSSSLDTSFVSLTSLIQTLNSLSPSLPAAAGSSATEDPLTQIAAILNAHLSSLQWIEGTTDSLKTSVRELESRVGDVGRKMGVNTSAAAAAYSQKRGGAFGESTNGGGGSPRGQSPFARR